MIDAPAPKWRAFRALLKANWQRAKGRRRRQRQILEHREGKGAIDWSWLGIAAAVNITMFIHGLYAFVLVIAATAAERAAGGPHIEWGDLAPLLNAGKPAAMFGSIVLLWWLVALVLQGEGLELDVQRRRHPMWEWLFTHPAPAAAVFGAEMLAPVVANPAYLTAPVFVGALYTFVYGLPLGLLAGVLGGVPIATACAFVGKSLEIGAMLRLAPDTRGFHRVYELVRSGGAASGYFSSHSQVPRYAQHAYTSLRRLTALPWPYLGLLLGQADGRFSIVRGLFRSAGCRRELRSTCAIR